MDIEETTIDELRKYLINCIGKKGLIEGKRSFSLQLGVLENDLFSEMDELYPPIFHFAEYSILEELPVVDNNGDALKSLNAVS